MRRNHFILNLYKISHRSPVGDLWSRSSSCKKLDSLPHIFTTNYTNIKTLATLKNVILLKYVRESVSKVADWGSASVLGRNVVPSAGCDG